MTNDELMSELKKLPIDGGLQMVDEPGKKKDNLYYKLKELGYVYTKETHEDGVIAVGLTGYGQTIVSKMK